MIYESFGTLRYRDDKWCSLMCCAELGRYYRALIHDDKLMPPMWGTHITVVNGRWETVTNPSAWRKHEGRRVWFTYSNEMQYAQSFYFLFAFSEEIGDLREDLGLSRVFARRPLHLTLGRNAPSNREKLMPVKSSGGRCRIP